MINKVPFGQLNNSLIKNISLKIRTPFMLRILSDVILGECPRNIMVTSTGKAKKWKEKLGKFNLIHYDESANAVYELALKKQKYFLHRLANSSTWIVSISMP